MKSHYQRLLCMLASLFVACAGRLHAQAQPLDGVEPLPQEWVQGNVGIFIGVGNFRNSPKNNLPGPPNDAVTLANVFVRELKLIPAGRAFVVIEGPLTPESGRLLDELKRAGVGVATTGTKADILAAISKAGSLTPFTGSLLSFFVSTHGEEWNGTPYISPSDGMDVNELVREVAEAKQVFRSNGNQKQYEASLERAINRYYSTLVCLTQEVEPALKSISSVSRQILFSDACRVERSRDIAAVLSRSLSVGSRDQQSHPEDGSPIRARIGSFDQNALNKLQYSVLVGACSPGQTSLEVGGVGIFSRTFADAVRGKAANPGASTVSISDVLAFVAVEAEKSAFGSLRAQGKSDSDAKREAQRAWYRGELAALSIPLVKVKGANPAAGPATLVTTNTIQLLIARLQQSVRNHPSLFSADDRQTVNQIVSLLASPVGRNYSWVAVELEMILAPSDLKRTKDVAAFVRSFALREQRRIRLEASIKLLRQDTTLGATEAMALGRLEAMVKQEMPPTADRFFDELEKHFVSGGNQTNRQALAWWVGWNRGQRQEATLARLSQCQQSCSIADNRLVAYREILQAVRTNHPPRLDALLDELDMRLPTSGCFAFESTINWWFEQKLDDQKKSIVDLLAKAKSLHSQLVLGNEESLNRLIKLLADNSGPRIEALLVELLTRFSPSKSDSASFQNLLSWWRDIERQQRLATATETLVAMIKAVPSSDPCQNSLTQIYGTLGKAKPPILDELIDELDRRLDLYDSASASLTCEWWRGYRCRARRGVCISTLNEAGKQAPGEASGTVFQQITNSIQAMSCEEVEPILFEVESKIAAKDPSTLRQVLAWFDKRYLKPPTWSVVVAVAEGATDVKQANDLAGLLVKQFQTRTIGSKITFSDKIISLDNESQAALICRELDAKAVLLLKLLPPDPLRRDPNSALGRITVAEVTIQALPIRPGTPIKPLVFPGKYIDPRNNPEKFVIQKAFEKAIMTASEDIEMSSALGLQLFLPKR